MNKVFIVTESPQIASIVVSKLERDGMAVSWKKEAGECLASQASGPADLIVLESVLPDMSGFELLQKIHGMPGSESVPVFVLLDVMQEKTEEDFIRAGAGEVLAKPFRPTILSKKIRKILSIPAFAGMTTSAKE